LLCHRVELVEQAAKTLSELPEETLRPAENRIFRMQSRLAAPRAFSMETFKQLNDQIHQLRVETIGAEAAANQTPEDGKRSPVELF
jgi:beta-N-acetylhexosaminidase